MPSKVVLKDYETKTLSCYVLGPSWQILFAEVKVLHLLTYSWSFGFFFIFKIYCVGRLFFCPEKIRLVRFNSPFFGNKICVRIRARFFPSVLFAFGFAFVCFFSFVRIGICVRFFSHFVRVRFLFVFARTPLGRTKGLLI